YFNASATSVHYGYEGDVYVHIGVVEGSWRYVPAEWEENIDKCKMTREADNVWSITLSPDIRTWFGVSEDDYVYKIGVVFRSSDSTKKGLDEDYIISVTDNTFTPGEISYEARPAKVIDGINIIDNSTVTLVLYDKDKNGDHKDYAYVIGDFNDWKLLHDYQMKRDDATGCWWYTLTGLDPQTEYAFQYYVYSKADGPIRLADAYTEKVLDPLDSYISASTYPNLRKYPSDKTSDIVSTFRTQKEDYNWKVLNFKVEDPHALVIYEMLFRDFSDSGDINGALGHLDHLVDMGINAIELMPVQEFDGNDSWGYNPCFFFALDKAYGTKEMYKQFIDACHEKGIAVILDVVYNHATGNHPFAKLYWDSSNNKTAANNPWFNVDAPHPYSVFHDFNHESELVRTFVKRNLQFLIKEYNIDGFRFDLTKGFTQNSSTDQTASKKDESRIAILKDYYGAIREVSSDVCMILEHFADDDEENELAEAGMMMWRNVNYAYCQSAMGWPESSDFSRMKSNWTATGGGWVGYMESHDEERMAYKQTQWGNYDLKDNLKDRMSQLETNAAFFFTVPGPKMIWQFGEMGYDISIEENSRTGRKPLKWEYMGNEYRKGLYDTYATLINFRQKHPELFTPGVTFDWKVSASDWEGGRFLSSDAGHAAMVVVGNFTDTPIKYAVSFPRSGVWFDYLQNEQINTSELVEVPAHNYRLFVNF
ncbi:MAG: alpha-amylase, partial [Bacteroides sp.]|nr:alpha-amylase [Bacteroides sp.]